MMDTPARSTYKALVLNSTSELLALETRTIQEALPGTAIVKVLGTYILSYLSDVLDGTLPYAIKLPMVPGANCIGRVHSVGRDAVSLREGQLVLCDITVTARDAPELSILMGLHGGGAPALMDEEWRDGSFAEYAKFPLENVFALDEERLFGKLGYKIEDLCSIPGFLVPFGGLSEINLLPGESVIVAPATGRFGGGAVTTALAMGATVIACGRNAATLKALMDQFSHTGRLETIILTGDAERDAAQMISASGNKGGGADAFIDFSPAEAVNANHISAALAALKPFGRAALMGGIWGKIEIDYNVVMMKSLRIQGRFMYHRDMVVRFIKMIEKGNLKLGQETGVRTIGTYRLEEIREALDIAKKAPGWGKQVILIP